MDRELEDLRVLAITWNMGGSDNKNLFQGQFEKLFPDVDQFQMVFFSSQECLGNKMNFRINQLELHLKS